MVEEYDHRYVRICHSETNDDMTLKNGRWNAREQFDYFYFWDVRCVAPIFTIPADTTFEVRRFKICVRARKSEYEKPRPDIAEIQEHHLLNQFVVSPACRAEDLDRDHLALIKKMPAEMQEAGPQFAFSAPKARRSYKQEFLLRCHVIANERPPERSRQPEENAHVKPRTKRK